MELTRLLKQCSLTGAASLTWEVKTKDMLAGGEVRRTHALQGQCRSVTGMRAELAISRNMVRTCVRSEVVPEYNPPCKRVSELDEYRGQVATRLAERMNNWAVLLRHMSPVGKALPTAVLDGLLHHIHFVSTRRESYRLREKGRTGLSGLPQATPKELVLTVRDR